MESGKKVCNELKNVRKQIAEANGIEYTPNECTHKGDCPGTCPACENEVRYIERELSLRRKLGVAVVVAGLGLAVSSCAPGCGRTAGDVANSCDSTEMILEGDVVSVGDSIDPEENKIEDIAPIEQVGDDNSDSDSDAGSDDGE